MISHIINTWIPVYISTCNVKVLYQQDPLLVAWVYTNETIKIKIEGLKVVINPTI